MQPLAHHNTHLPAPSPRNDPTEPTTTTPVHAPTHSTTSSHQLPRQRSIRETSTAPRTHPSGIYAAPRGHAPARAKRYQRHERVCSTPPLRSVRLYVSCQPWQPWGSRRRRTRRGAGGTRSTGTRRGCARSACATASRASPPRSPALPRRRRRRRRRRDPPPRCARRPGRGVTPPRRRPRCRPSAAARGWAC